MLKNIKIKSTDVLGRAKIVTCPEHGQVEVVERPENMIVESKPFSSDSRVSGNQSPGLLSCGCGVSPINSFLNEDELKEWAITTQSILERVHNTLYHECEDCTLSEEECDECKLEKGLLKPFFEIISFQRYDSVFGAKDIEELKITPDEMEKIHLIFK